MARVLLVGALALCMALLCLHAQAAEERIASWDLDDAAGGPEPPALNPFTQMFPTEQQQAGQPPLNMQSSLMAPAAAAQVPAAPILNAAPALAGAPPAALEMPSANPELFNMELDELNKNGAMLQKDLSEPRFQQLEAAPGMPVTKTTTAIDGRPITTLVTDHYAQQLSQAVGSSAASQIINTLATASAGGSGSSSGSSGRSSMSGSRSFGSGTGSSSGGLSGLVSRSGSGSSSLSGSSGGSSLPPGVTPARKHIITTTQTVVSKRKLPPRKGDKDRPRRGRLSRDQREEREDDEDEERDKAEDESSSDEESEESSDDDEGHRHHRRRRHGRRGRHHRRRHGRRGRHHRRRHHRRHSDSDSDSSSSSSDSSSGSSSSSSSSSESDEDHPPRRCPKKLKVRVAVSEEGGCEEEKVDPMVAAKQAKLKKLEALLADKQKQFQAETNWLTQAEALIGTLKKKTTNVRQHLNDVHKAMTELHFNERQVRRQLNKMEAGAQAAAAIKKLEKELAELLSHSQNVKQQVTDLQGKKAEYRSRIEEIKNTVNKLKAQHLKNKAAASPAPAVFVAQPACSCYLPVVQRPRGCSC